MKVPDFGSMLKWTLLTLGATGLALGLSCAVRDYNTFERYQIACLNSGGTIVKFSERAQCMKINYEHVEVKMEP
jgi:hypothetical protein